MRRTPTSVMVLGIMGIVLSGLGFLGTAASVLGVLMPSDLTPSLNKDAGYFTYVIASAIVNLLLYILLIAASIGSLRLKRWARKGMLTYAMATLVLLVVGTAMTIGYVTPKLNAAIGPKVPQEQADLLRASLSMAPLCGLAGAIFPIFVLVFFTRKKVVNAFDGIFPPDPAYLAQGYAPPLPNEPNSPFP
jgi:hypothetical protein